MSMKLDPSSETQEDRLQESSHNGLVRELFKIRPGLFKIDQKQT